jgi:hypothetical protein
MMKILPKKEKKHTHTHTHTQWIAAAISEFTPKELLVDMGLM